MSVKKCPHCGKTLESEIPDGWIKIPLKLWNDTVDALNKADRIADCEKRLDDFFRAIEHATVHLAKALAEVDAARRATK